MIVTARFIATAAFAGALALAGGAFPGATALAQSKPDIRIGTGTQGGAYYRMGAVLADALVRSGLVNSATAEASSGAIESSRLADRGVLQIAGMDNAWVHRAMNGLEPYKEKLELRTVVPMGAWPLFFVARTDAGIATLDDLKGKRVAVGARGSGMENHARVLFGALGMSFDDIRTVHLGFGPGSQAVREGKADAQLQCCLPNTAMTQLSELADVRAVNMDAHIDKIMEVGKTYARGTLAAGAFKGHDQDMTSLSILQGWMASPKLADETAYVFAKVFIENLDDLAKKMPQYESVKPMLAEAREKNSLEPIEIGAPMHPGAVRAFKEAGIVR